MDLGITDRLALVSGAALAAKGREHGGIDICVHATGIIDQGDPLDLTDDAYDEAWAIDFMSAARAAGAVVPGMVDKRWGRIVSMANRADELGVPVAEVIGAFATFVVGSNNRVDGGVIQAMNT